MLLSTKANPGRPGDAKPQDSSSQLGITEKGRPCDKGGALGDGAQLIQWPATGGANQQWSFTPTGDGYYKFSPASQPNASLDVNAGSGTQGTAVQQWSWHGSSWQQWAVVPAN